jgi:N-methylhydantoinase A
MCYGAGGSEVTVTDAHVALGRIPPRLLGGEISLDVAAARRGIDELASTLRLSGQACAVGILEISAWNQANALRRITVKRGMDVRDFALVTFGGSGSLLACRLMDVLGVPTVVVPPTPGNVSAFGLLTVDVKNDYVRTALAKHAELDIDRAEAIFAELRSLASAALDREGFARDQHRFDRSADLRYFGQAFEVGVPVPDRPFDKAAAHDVAGAFHDAHRALYGYDFAGDTRQHVEWVNLRVSGIGPIARPELPELPGRSGPAPYAGVRRVCFDEYVEASIYRRTELGPGDKIAGPAIIEEFGATVPIHPGFCARVDTFGNLVVTRS